MTPARREVVLFLSAPATTARRELAATIEAEKGSRLTVYVRDTDRKHYEDLLEHCFVRSDKPTGGKREFVLDLRSTLYEEAIVLDYGEWSYYPSRSLFFLARALVKTVHTERGQFEFSFLKPITLLRHWSYRRKHRSGSVAGLPPGTPAPFLVAAFRKTLGLGLGVTWIVLEYGYRRLARSR